MYITKCVSGHSISRLQSAQVTVKSTHYVNQSKELKHSRFPLSFSLFTPSLRKILGNCQRL
jgi:hypothetical protein